MQHQSVDRNTSLIFIVSLLIGLGFRLYIALSTEMWNDEVISVILSRLSFSELLLSNGGYWDHIHPPFYYVVLKIWSFFFNELLPAPKILSVVLYTFSVYLLFKIGRNLRASKEFSIAAFLFSIHPLMVFIGVNARMYSLLLFFILTSSYFLTKLTANKTTQHVTIFLAAFFLFLAFYTAYAAIWFFFPLTIVLAWSLFRIRHYFLKLVEMLVLFLVLSSYQLLHFFKVVFVYKVRAGSVSDEQYFSEQLSKYWKYFISLLGIGESDTFSLDRVFSVILILIFGAIFFALRRKNPKSYLPLLFLFGFLAPVSFAILFSILVTPYFIDRNHVVSLLSLLVFISYFIAQLSQTNFKLAVYILLVLSGLYINFSLASRNFFPNHIVESIKKADLDENANIMLLSNRNPFEEYYIYNYVDRKKPLARLQQGGISLDNLVLQADVNYYIFYDYLHIENKEEIESDHCNNNCYFIPQ